MLPFNTRYWQQVHTLNHDLFTKSFPTPQADTYMPCIRLWMLIVYSLVTTSLMADRPFFFSPPFLLGAIWKMDFTLNLSRWKLLFRPAMVQRDNCYQHDFHTFLNGDGAQCLQIGLGKLALPAGRLQGVQKCIWGENLTAIFPWQLNKKMHGGVVVHMTCQQVSGLALSCCNVIGDI